MILDQSKNDEWFTAFDVSIQHQRTLDDITAISANFLSSS